MPQGFAIAIDGPVASGKGTLATRLARELNGFYLYSGAMYRSVALACIKKGLDVTDPEQVLSVLPNLAIRFSENSIFLNDEDVTDRIHESDTASGGSMVAVIPQVRKILVKRQQELAQEAITKGQIVVAEGRDTGTVVLPDAALKIFLTATPEVRAKRRLVQYKDQAEKTFEEMLTSVKKRDERDTTRKMDPLPSDPEARGYVVINDSELTEDETFQAVIAELKKRLLI